MQASLDLAKLGYLVYLAEKRHNLGSIMTKRDKHLPENNCAISAKPCAMCTLSPLLISVLNHRNINIFTEAEVIDLEGEPGSFRAKILQRTNNVDYNRILGCGACAKVSEPDNNLSSNELCWDCKEKNHPENIIERVLQLEMDAVILTGRNANKLGQILDIRLKGNRNGLNKLIMPGHTARPGIFTCGNFSGPKDVAETVIDASSTAAQAAKLLAPIRNKKIDKVYPVERNVNMEKPKVGVFICNGGNNIARVVNMPEILSYAKNLKNVDYVSEYLHLCSPESIAKMKEMIIKYTLNRVVIASCTPNVLEALIKDGLREIGLNPYLYEHVNIREQVSWVHSNKPEKATEKTKDLVKMAVAKAPLLRPVSTTHADIIQASLIIGGGVAGMISALSLADQGYQTVLVEKNNELDSFIGELKEKVLAAPNIQVFLKSKIKDVAGFPGRYKTTIAQSNGGTTYVEHGTVIIATGASSVKPKEYLYSQHPAVITQQELEQRISQEFLSGVKTVVMVQCVGLKEVRPYCSKNCCTEALRNAWQSKK
ncbi:hypothetical protein N752_09190 [Desulforamulus aquiferis]|nr:FAD-dependent oxidoreductase [Desulforamulus aquiferis]RYD05510.1 hypothetical protein N752_09190 [Desulforamulus aquiferis]